MGNRKGGHGVHEYSLEGWVWYSMDATRGSSHVFSIDSQSVTVQDYLLTATSFASMYFDCFGLALVFYVENVENYICHIMSVGVDSMVQRTIQNKLQVTSFNPRQPSCVSLVVDIVV